MKNLSLAKGFSLIELMVVVAIIGVLSAIAIPNYQKFQAKARQSEAKIALSAVYTSQQTYASEQTTFTACLLQIGWDARGTGNRYYSTGFLDNATVTGANCGPVTGAGVSCLNWQFDAAGAGTVACLDAQIGAAATNGTFLLATLGVGGNASVRANLLGGTVVSKTNFTVAAAGRISTGAPIDVWTIDENKLLNNTVSGI